MYANMKYLMSYFSASEQSVPVVIFTCLVAVVLWNILRNKKQKEMTMTWEEEEAMLREFTPEPLVPENSPELPPFKRVVQSRAGKRVVVNGIDCLNLATFNYLGFVEDEDVLNKASDCISRYGVGSCGPRGFYGTADVHLDLEERLAEFLKVEETCVYSYGFCTFASAIPAYCKRRDIIFADEAVNFAIQKGFDASRSKIIYFKHNDMKDLEAKLEANPADEKQRRFLVAEGVYINTGDMCPLPELVQLRSKHKLRMFLDESVSFGTIGATGRGVLEHFNVPLHEVDLRMGSMEGALASIGGFTCGASFIVEHQRLSGLGYCFSASLPPLLAVAAITALGKLKENPDMVLKLQKISQELHKAVENIPGTMLMGNALSPLKHLRITNSDGYTNDLKLLRKISDICLDSGLAVVPPSYLESEKFPQSASLRIIANINLTSEDIKYVADTLRLACKDVL